VLAAAVTIYLHFAPVAEATPALTDDTRPSAPLTGRPMAPTSPLPMPRSTPEPSV